MKTLQEHMIAALVAIHNAQRNQYPYPARHYQSVRRRRPNLGRRYAKRVAYDVMLERVRQDREREHAYRYLGGAKPDCLHASSRPFA